jgi:hypothetical protein
MKNLLIAFGMLLISTVVVNGQDRGGNGQRDSESPRSERDAEQERCVRDKMDSRDGGQRALGNLYERSAERQCHQEQAERAMGGDRQPQSAPKERNIEDHGGRN